MSPINYYLEAFTKKYAQFDGRARRSEYWYFALFNMIAAMLLLGLDTMMGLPMVLYGVYALASFVPSIGMLVRRLHDTNRSGWWFFIALIPIVGSILLLVWLCTDSNPGDNNYGQNPKEVSHAGMENILDAAP